MGWNGTAPHRHREMGWGHMKKSGRSIAAFVAACLVVGALSVAPAAASVGTAADAKTTFVAKVPGTDALIGIVVGKKSAVAYVCDGADLDEWLTGAVSNGVLALESETGSTLVGTVGGNKLKATLVLPDGRVINITAVKAKGKAGLFEKGDTVDGITLTKAWVRLADGTTRGNGLLQNLVDAARQGVQNVVTEIQQGLQGLGVTDPPPVNVLPPIGPGVGSTNGVVTVCPPFFVLVSGSCIQQPPIPVPPAVPPDASPAAPPAQDDTVANQNLKFGDIAVPPPGTFDATACARIERALALLSDELSTLKPGKTADLFTVVFTNLRTRATAGGCADLPEAP